MIIKGLREIEALPGTERTEYFEEMRLLCKNRRVKKLTNRIALSVIAMADEEYDVTLKGDDIRNANTIEDLFNIVKSK